MQEVVRQDMHNTETGQLKPLYFRRGSERTLTLHQPNNIAVSINGRDGNSSQGDDIQKQPSSAKSRLRIDVIKANTDCFDLPPASKTPTESIKDSLYKLTGLGKPSTRFIID